MSTSQPQYQDPRAGEQVLSWENGQIGLINVPPQLAPPPQFGRSPQFVLPPLFGRPPPLVRPQQRDGVAPSTRSEVDVPATAQVPGPLADFGTRAISFLIDCVAPVIVVNVLLAFGVATGSLVLTVAGYLGLGAFGLWNSCYLQGTSGQSVGRRVAGTKLVEIETGRPIGFGRALLRQCCHGLEFVIGFLWPLWDGKRQTFADKIADTVVIRVEGATNVAAATAHRRLAR